MIGTKAKREIADSQPASTLGGWESEGGASTRAVSRHNREERAFRTEAEKHVLQCLGAAVIVQWNNLPSRVQRQLFDNATAVGKPCHTAQLKEQIARFLHKHKDDIREPEDAPIA
jgi:hypothetical protein